MASKTVIDIQRKLIKSLAKESLKERLQKQPLI